MYISDIKELNLDFLTRNAPFLKKPEIFCNGTIKNFQFYFKKFVSSSDKVFIVGHLSPDLDSIGSCVGMATCAIHERKQRKQNGIFKLSKRENKELNPDDVYVVLNDPPSKIDPSVRKVLNEKCVNITFINVEQMKQLMTNNDTLIICDVNQKYRTAVSEFIDYFKYVLICDHHEVNSKTINPSKFTKLLIDPNMSSACEIVHRLMKSMGIKCSKELATILLAGIHQDTQNYTLKRNLTIWSIINSLVQAGADQEYIQYLNPVNFSEDSEIWRKINQYGNDIFYSFELTDTIIDIDDNKQTIDTKNTMSVLLIPEQSSRIELSKIANRMTDYSGLSIVIGVIEENNEKKVSIHVRSNGRVKAGDIAKQFGGSGDNGMGAAQLPYIEDLSQIRDKVLSSSVLPSKVLKLDR